MKIVSLQKEHYPEVSKIYEEGLATGIATFETKLPSWEEWNAKFSTSCRLVAMQDQEVLGWCALSMVSKRKVYSGVAENTIYIAAKHQGKGYGKILLQHLVEASENAGFWTLQAGIFPQNKASIQLHKSCGFRTVGVRHKIGQRNGKWFDNILMERRSNKTYEK